METADVLVLFRRPITQAFIGQNVGCTGTHFH